MFKRLNRVDWGIIIVLLLPLITALPAWGDGIPSAADVEVHVHRIHAMSLALQEGNLYPRWISYFHLGYGYPIFNFYAPGYAYFTALFEIAGLHITTAYNLVQTLAWSFGSLGMYLLARRFMSIPAAILASALWTFAPSRLYEVWWQGSIAQIIAASFMPYLILGVVKNSEKPSMRNMLAIALPYAAMMMSHTPMMYISTLYAAPLAFFAPMVYTKLDMKSVLIRWGFIGTSFALGIGLSAIFLMPTLLELQYVQISQGIDETVNYLIQQYLPLSEIFAFPRLIDRTDLYLDFPRTLGLIGGTLSIFGCIALIKRKQYGLTVITLAGLAFTVFMLLDISFDVWLTIPAFANLRFPARLLRMGAIFVSIMGGASILLLPKKWQIMGMIVGIILAIIQILPISQPYDVWLYWDNISAYDEILHEQEDRTWGTVSYDEFNPIWGDRIFLDVPTTPERYIDEPFHLRVFGRDIAAVNWEGFSEENISDNTLIVTTDVDRAVRFRQYYFPGWQATVNGEPAEIYPDEQIGLITIDLPAGEHIVTLKYVGTMTQLVATVISMMSIVICLGLFQLGKPNSAEDNLAENRFSLKFAILLIAGIGIFALGNKYIIQPNNWFKYQSSATEPRYMQTALDVSFGEQITLLGYTLNEDVVSSNNPLDIDLYWHIPESIDTNYRPIVQLINLTQTDAWATSSRLQPSAGEFSTFTSDRFARDPYSLRLFETDIPPYVGQISVQLVNDDGALTLPDGSDRLILEPIIRVNTDSVSLNTTWDDSYLLGDIAELTCATINIVDENYDITLQWHTLGQIQQDLVVMIQGLDANGELVVSGDAPPFGGNYPSYFWQVQQDLVDTHSLIFDPSIETIAVGLYTRDTVQRLEVTRNGSAIPNNQIILTLDENSCSQ